MYPKVGVQFDDQNVERLINYVQMQPVLFNPKEKDYKDRQLVYNIWSSIAEKLNQKTKNKKSNKDPFTGKWMIILLYNYFDIIMSNNTLRFP